MAKLLTLPVVDEAENAAPDDIEALLVELLGDSFEDTVITDSGRVLYVSTETETKTVNR